ncbi:MAG: serine hydrolase family protein [Cytophagaceae bacterium]|nr:MAG: serine hydrolase family protein [Cytophagaceae bacterium]
MLQPTRFFIVPGLGGSGPDHWQTQLAQRHPGNFERVQQRDWDAPDRAEWVATLAQALAGEDLRRVVLVAHSLGCATVAHWAAQHGQAIRGALLVAPADVDTAHFASFPTTGFAPMPQQRLPFASKVVASTTDEWVTPARAAQFAAAWGSQLVNAGPAGHLNAASGYGLWPAAEHLLRAWWH